jgi:hypothetical protein
MELKASGLRIKKKGQAPFLFLLVVLAYCQSNIFSNDTEEKNVIASEIWQPCVFVIASEAWQSHREKIFIVNS